MNTFTRPLYRDYKSIEADLPALLEIARLALADHRFCTSVLEEELDMELWELQEKIEKFMDEPLPSGSTGSPLARALAAVPGYNPEAGIDPARIDGAASIMFWTDRAWMLNARDNAAVTAYARTYDHLVKVVGDKEVSKDAANRRAGYAESAFQAVYQEG